MIDVWRALVRVDIQPPSQISKKPFPHLFSSPPGTLSVSDVDAMEDLLFELSSVRKFVKQEYQWFRSVEQKHQENENPLSIEKVADSHLTVQRKRLMYLFVRDLTKGVSGEVLENKERRDFRKLEKVALEMKIVTWIFVIFLNLGFLFYVYLFAMKQTQSRQSAWFRSFIIWLFFEILLSSTGVVFLVHFLIPLCALSEVTKMKDKILIDLAEFRNELFTKFKTQDFFVGLNHQNKVSFNAAKYLFSSWRVASLCQEIPESKLILQFNTPWPKRRFGRGGNGIELSSYYEETIVLNAILRFFLSLFVSLLHAHNLSQDLLFQLVNDCCLSYGIYLMICLFSISPFLPFLVSLVVVGLISIMSKEGKLIQKFHSVSREHEPDESNDLEKLSDDGSISMDDLSFVEDGYPLSLVFLDSRNGMSDSNSNGQDSALWGDECDSLDENEGTTSDSSQNDLFSDEFLESNHEGHDVEVSLRA